MIGTNFRRPAVWQANSITANRPGASFIPFLALELLDEQDRWARPSGSSLNFPGCGGTRRARRSGGRGTLARLCLWDLPPPEDLSPSCQIIVQGSIFFQERHGLPDSFVDFSGARSQRSGGLLHSAKSQVNGL